MIGNFGITLSEHLKFVNPKLIFILTWLFNCICKIGFVPNGFGVGLMVPLLKWGNVDSTKVDNYRGLTISPVISKLFEYVVFDLCRNFFVSSELQFGFKSKIGCNTVIYNLNNVTNYFTIVVVVLLILLH